MTITFEQKIEANGEIWFLILQDNFPIHAIKQTEDTPEAEQKARDLYQQHIVAAKNGYPIRTILESKSFT